MYIVKVNLKLQVNFMHVYICPASLYSCAVNHVLVTEYVVNNGI